MLDVLVFGIDEARYGVAAAHVVEVVRAVAVTPLPGSPAVVEGVIDFRGRLVPVFDLRRRFGHPPRGERLEDHFVIVRAAQRLAALRADRTEQLVQIDPAAIEDPRRHVATAAEQVTGVARLPDGLLLIQDPERFLSAAEREVLDAALAEAARTGEPGDGVGERGGSPGEGSRGGEPLE